MNLPFLVNTTLAVEKLRVAAQVRCSHLERQGRKDVDTEEIHRRLQNMEDYIDGRIAELLKEHLAYKWFSKVKGIGKENIGKVIGMIDIEKADTISSLWKFCGYSVENGHAPKRIRNSGKLCYNSRLRSMCWRMGSSLLRAKGCFYDYYCDQKTTYISRFANQGVNIVPANSLPIKDGKRYEPEDTISVLHVHNMALRKMVKLFLSCLWLVWREEAGLSITKPYSISKLGHTSYIEPWKMVDR